MRCYGCGIIVAAQKTLALETIPELLLDHLKRFTVVDGQMKKVETNVGVPSTIVVSDGKYQLAGVVKHSENKSSGDYVADIITTRGRLTLDDHHMMKTQRKEMSWCYYFMKI